MALFDEDDRDSNASSDNEHDELMEDADEIEADIEAEPDVDMDQVEDEEIENDEGDEDEDEEETSKSGYETSKSGLPAQQSASSHTVSASGSQDSPSHTDPGPTSNPRFIRTSASPRASSISTARLYPTLRPEALNASSYDIVPTMAVPQSTSVNALTATPDLRYWFSGGADCYVRKYDGPATINGKALLTVAQRHPYVDSVTKAGVLMTYWGNEEPRSKMNEEPDLSPVYSLAVQRQGMWLLSGLESGAINLQSVRVDCGTRITSLEQHTSAVSVLTLAADEKSVLSGSWDKSIIDWDLNTGQVKRTFACTGQISSIQMRPASSLPVPEESGDLPISNGTMSSNNASKPATNGGVSLVNGPASTAEAVNATEEAPSPTVGDADSLFGDGGDGDSLFGGDDAAAPSGGQFGGDDDDDEFSKAMNAPAVDHDNHDTDPQPEEPMLNSSVSTLEGDVSNGTANPNGIQGGSRPEVNASESEDPVTSATPPPPSPTQPQESALVPDLTGSEPAFLPRSPKPTTQDPHTTSDSTFISSSYNGTLMIWDRRQPNPVARIPSRTGGPWCMDACWSPDGNTFYAGRRNNTVEEYSLHKGLKEPSRIFKFPVGSGPVSSVRAMPNGRHLICASYDILRLYDLQNPAASLPSANIKHATVPFLIVPGPPRPGVISSLYIDPTCKYMITAAGNRGWEGATTECLIGYEIACIGGESGDGGV